MIACYNRPRVHPRPRPANQKRDRARRCLPTGPPTTCATPRARRAPRRRAFHRPKSSVGASRIASAKSTSQGRQRHPVAGRPFVFPELPTVAIAADHGDCRCGRRIVDDAIVADAAITANDSAAELAFVLGSQAGTLERVFRERRQADFDFRGSCVSRVFQRDFAAARRQIFQLLAMPSAGLAKQEGARFWDFTNRPPARLPSGSTMRRSRVSSSLIARLSMVR